MEFQTGWQQTMVHNFLVPHSSTSQNFMDLSIKQQAHTAHSLMAWQRKLFKQLRTCHSWQKGHKFNSTWVSKYTYLGSPAQRLLGQRTKTLLPTTTELLKKQKPSAHKLYSGNLVTGKCQKFYYDCHTTALIPIPVKDRVIIRAKGKWEPSIVIAIS